LRLLISFGAGCIAFSFVASSEALAGNNNTGIAWSLAVIGFLIVSLLTIFYLFYMVKRLKIKNAFEDLCNSFS